MSHWSTRVGHTSHIPFASQQGADKQRNKEREALKTYDSAICLHHFESLSSVFRELPCCSLEPETAIF